MTGFGAVSATGCGRASVAAALRDGTPSWTEVDRSEGFHRRLAGRHRGGARLAGLVTDADLSAWLAPRKARRMSRPSRFAVSSAVMALAEAGVDPGEELRGLPTAVIVSNAFGPSAFTEKIQAQIRDSGPREVSPAHFTESVVNAPAAQIAIVCKARGANITVTQRQAGALIALALAATELSRGRAGLALVVTVDEVTPLLHAVLDRFGALARAAGEGVEAARPFDRRRNGFMIAEGAVALVVETAESAERRGVRVLAHLRGTAGAFDPGAPVTGWGSDTAVLAPRLQRMLDAAGDVDAVITGASGAVTGDLLEGRLLRSRWPPGRLPPTVAPKSVLGELGGAQLAAALLALGGETFGPTAGFSEVDPAVGIKPHGGGRLNPSAVLVSSLAAGGATSWAVLAAEP